MAPPHQQQEVQLIQSISVKQPIQPSRKNSCLLSVNQIKDNLMAENVNETNNRNARSQNSKKIYVSIAKSNR
jgi:hypothetical protein